MKHRNPRFGCRRIALGVRTKSLVSAQALPPGQYCRRRRDHSPVCGRYVTPDEAAMERAYNLTGRQWEAWMDEATGRATTSHPRG